MEDDILLYCGKQEISYSQLTERFGKPRDVASDFFAGLDAKAVSRYSYSRLKVTYAILAVVLVVALCSIGVKLYDYIQTRVFWEHTKSGEACGVWHPCYKIHKHEPYVCMPEGAEDCAVIRVRTLRDGKDCYWEYHSCINRFNSILQPENWDGTEPYAEEFYVTHNGIPTHWRFDEKHTGWYKIFDDV